jgi:hypothetical protein
VEGDLYKLPRRRETSRFEEGDLFTHGSSLKPSRRALGRRSSTRTGGRTTFRAGASPWIPREGAAGCSISIILLAPIAFLLERRRAVFRRRLDGTRRPRARTFSSRTGS